MIPFRLEVSILRAFILAISLLLFWPSLQVGARAGDEPRVFNVEGDVAGAHDPSIIKEADTWYVFVKPSGGWASGTETKKLTAGDGKPGFGGSNFSGLLRVASEYVWVSSAESLPVFRSSFRILMPLQKLPNESHACPFSSRMRFGSIALKSSSARDCRTRPSSVQ